MKKELACGKCGGTTSTNVDDRADSALAECACGGVLFWAKHAEKDRADPPVLGISIGDHIRTDEQVG